MFIYRTGSDLDRYTMKGTWIIENSVLYLSSASTGNLLHWICSYKDESLMSSYRREHQLPKGAVVKNYGVECLGKDYSMIWSGMNKGNELTITADEV